MVMMLTAGLGVSEMMIGWDNIALEVGGVTLLLLSNDAVDIPLHTREKGEDDEEHRRRRGKHPQASTNLFLFSPRLAFAFFLSGWALAWAVLLLKLKLLQLKQLSLSGQSFIGYNRHMESDPYLCKLVNIHLQLCCCWLALSTVSRGDSATLD